MLMFGIAIFRVHIFIILFFVVVLSLIYSMSLGGGISLAMNDAVNACVTMVHAM